MKRNFLTNINSTTTASKGRPDELVMLSPNTQVLLRDSTHLQFGVNPQRAALIETAHAARLLAIFHSTITPVSRQCLQSALEECGLSSDQAWSILTDLVEYRILVACPASASVTVLGRNDLRTQLDNLLTAVHVVPRCPPLGQQLTTYFQQTTPHITVLANRRLSTLADCAAVVENCPTIIPIELVDGRTIIGPLRLNKRGACPLCLDLYRSDREPSWVKLMNCLPARKPTEAITTTIAAALGCVLTQKALGRVVEPPGSPSFDIIPGSLLVIDPFQLSIEHYRMKRHRRCPLCSTDLTETGEDV